MRAALAILVFAVGCRREEPTPSKPTLMTAVTPAAATHASSAGTTKTTEIHGTGFHAQLPGIWREDAPGPSNELPEVHGYYQVEGSNAGLTTSRYVLKSGLPPEEREKAIDALVAVRRNALKQGDPTMKVGEPRRTTVGDAVVVALDADGAKAAIRFQLHVAGEDAIGVQYLDDSSAPRDVIDARWNAIRDAFAFR